MFKYQKLIFKSQYKILMNQFIHFHEKYELILSLMNSEYDFFSFDSWVLYEQR